MPQFNHKDQQFMDFRITLIGSSETSSKLVKRLEKVFERRRVADSTAGDGTRTIVMRDQSVVVLRPRPKNGGSGFSREPFLEMDVRTVDEYQSRSVAAMRAYAMKQNVVLYVDVERVPETDAGSKKPPRRAATERPQE